MRANQNRRRQKASSQGNGEERARELFLIGYRASVFQSEVSCGGRWCQAYDSVDT